ncbi:MAG: hypothetical protein JRG92_11430 [Deltaproteobacteria bacterium]|nr:hypothetical protein [Deltaproteobacteria bacterium]MBW2384238.1 hypothetical protein [Deltaproteobacteria bacterium]
MTRKRGRLCSVLLLLGLLATPGAAHARPEWVVRGGLSSEYPRERFVTGYGVASGSGALARAKQEAAADLARKLSVRIESELSDVSREHQGHYSYRLAAMTRSTTDVRLTGLHYAEPHKRWGKTHVLAWVDRTAATRVRLAERDRALGEVRACLAAGEAAREAGRKRVALETFEDCRRPVAEALQHQAVARALRPALAGEGDALLTLIGAARRLDGEIDAMLTGPSRDLARATDAMALQLARQGVSTRSRLMISHWNYGATNLSSSFGRQAGLELERALARTAADRDALHSDVLAPDIAITGVYLESGAELRLCATAREIVSGRLVASAEARMPVSAVPERLQLRPPNFDAALRDLHILAEAPVPESDLQLAVWTDKGRGGVLYTEHEELTLFMKVNQPAWVRLLYVLQGGVQVPIDQAFRIDSGRVGQVVEYPQRFEVVAPFGVEMIHATAFTTKPDRLLTREREIDGVHYEVIAEGLDAVVRTRGLALLADEPIAESTVTVTTTQSGWR